MFRRTGIRKTFPISVEGYGEIRGDVAWGGNWFFLIENVGPEITLSNVDALTEFCTSSALRFSAKRRHGRERRGN